MKTATQLRRSKAYIVILLALALAACAPLAAVKETKPRFTSQYGSAVEQAIAQGQKLEHNAPARAIGYYLSGVEISHANLRKDPGNTVALRDYNFALSRVYSVIRDATGA